MRLDGARSATRKEPEGGTCTTRVTRVTFDFQARDNFELRDKEGARACCKDQSFATRNLQGNFRCRAPKRLSKQKLVPRVTRVAHVPRRS